MTPPSVSFSYPRIWHVLNGGRPYEPFWYQAQHLHAKVDEGCKRIILAWGRRGGKSSAVIAEVAREVIKPPVVVKGIEHSPIVYIVGPNNEAAQRVWEPIWAAFVPADDSSYIPPLGFLHAGHDKQRGVIFIKGGGRIYRKSGESPAAMQGERVTLAVTDESQDMPEEVWQYLMPGLLESGGRLISIGVAKGRGRFRTYWFAGQMGDSQYYSSAIPSTANPVIRELAESEGKTPEQWLRENAGADLTDNEFRQQYLAEWTDEDGQVFRKFEHLFTVERLEGPIPGHSYYMGLDLGKINDFTVAYIGDVTTGEIVASERFNKIDYVDQAPALAEMAKHWGVLSVLMDVTGVGQAPYEMLVREGIPVTPYVFTNASKQALVSTMVREVERGNVRFLRDDDVLKREMSLFEGTVTAGGVVKYSAPAGYFDDCVTAAALVIFKMARNRSLAQTAKPQHYVSFSGSEKRSYMPPLPRPREEVAA